MLMERESCFLSINHLKLHNKKTLRNTTNIEHYEIKKNTLTKQIVGCKFDLKKE